MSLKGDLQVVYVKACDLLPYARNSRTHSEQQVAQIAASIKEFGFTNPVLISETNDIIAGHGRLLAAQLLGMESVPTITLAGLTEAQRRAYVIADNRLALNAGWDTKMLEFEMQELQAMEFDLGLTGFEEDEIESLLNPEVEGDGGGDGDGDELPEDVETRCKTGDLWQIGNHRLICGDSTSIDDVTRLMGGELADCVWTDPPYNVAYEGKTADALTIQNDKMGDESFLQFLTDAFVAMATVLKKGGAFYIAHADSEGFNFRGAVKKAELDLKQCLIWVKNTIVMGRQDYHWQHEPILYGWKPGAAHVWSSDRKQSTVLEFNKPSRNAEHPTMKPVELVAYCIKNNTKPGQIVLDLFGGSGTTLIASEQLKRHARLVELDPKYCDVILARWENLTGGKAVLLEKED